MKNLRNPYVAALVCMALFAVMHNYATTDFMRVCSYIPLAVVLVIFAKLMYHAYVKRNN